MRVHTYMSVRACDLVIIGVEGTFQEICSFCSFSEVRGGGGCRCSDDVQLLVDYCF